MSVKIARDGSGGHAIEHYGTCDGALKNWGPCGRMEVKGRMVRATNDLGLATSRCICCTSSLHMFHAQLGRVRMTPESMIRITWEMGNLYCIKRVKRGKVGLSKFT